MRQATDKVLLVEYWQHKPNPWKQRAWHAEAHHWAKTSTPDYISKRSPKLQAKQRTLSSHGYQCQPGDGDAT